MISALQQLPESLRDFVLFGAGNLGRQVGELLASQRTPALAFCDNNPALWETSVLGLPVMSPAEAATRFPEANFMVCMWHPAKTGGLRHRTAQLRELGCKHVFTFVPLFLAYPDIFLPNMFWPSLELLDREREAIAAARELFDEVGREEFDRQLRFRLGDAEALKDPESSDQYFPPDFFKVSREEVFVDCGAYDGDTLRDFLKNTNSRFSEYYALEPDPGTRLKLQKMVQDVGSGGRVHVLPYAVGERQETVRFSAAGTSSSIASDGELSVECIRLDDLLASQKPTFIKMDIEGFELDALAGCRGTMRRCRPKAAVCIYHRPDHLWRVPLVLNEAMPDSRFTLRMYRTDGYETVCYANPS